MTLQTQDGADLIVYNISIIQPMYGLNTYPVTNQHIGKTNRCKSNIK